MNSASLIQSYYQCFNQRDVEGRLALLGQGAVYEVSQGKTEVDKEVFRRFLLHMNRCYRGRIYALAVMINPDGSRGAEFMLDGEYLQTDGDLPPASGQKYTLRVGALFEIGHGQITRVSNQYDLKDWIHPVKPHGGPRLAPVSGSPMAIRANAGTQVSL